mmetsp:Transcript_12808/g.23026  ORF Transcript_12808/g.23026 Transcript_12808/m.23026 type:complete len:277 (-) Transcript_12808:61-891(-)
MALPFLLAHFALSRSGGGFALVFSPTTTARSSSSLLDNARRWQPRCPSSSPRTESRTTTTRVDMIFQKFFGGGAFEAGIDYDSLDHPGPELAMAAASSEGSSRALTVSKRDPELVLASFAGGCFWGLELAYQRVPGVVYTTVGYTQGREVRPTYTQVCAGATGHTEALAVYYDPKEVSYDNLLDVFFKRVDPTTVNGQGNDFGRQYRTGVYYHSEEQESIARARFTNEQLLYSKPIATELKSAMSFWPAEKYHQQYLAKGGQNAEKNAVETIRCYG